MMRHRAALGFGLLLGLAPSAMHAGDTIFERDLSTPFLRDDDDRFQRDRDLPGPLRKSWPYADAPEAPFAAVEARRACHARTLHEISKRGATDAAATARLQSAPERRLHHVVLGQYTAVANGQETRFSVRCNVSSQAVLTFDLVVEE